MIVFYGSVSGNRIAILDKNSISMIIENSKEECTEITFKGGADDELSQTFKSIKDGSTN